MLKRLISTFFTILFLSFIMAPTVINIVDNTVDISIFYTMTEEEEKGHETVKHLEVLNLDNHKSDFSNTSKSLQNATDYCFKTYTKPHLNLISPPPEHSV